MGEVESEEMSNFEQRRGKTDVLRTEENPGLAQERIFNEPTVKASADQLADAVNTWEMVKKEGPDIQPVKPSESLPQSKSAEITIPGDGEASQSDRARIERLGRERPAKFKSLGAEVTFCYSVIASQFMSVRSVAAALEGCS